MNHVHQSRLELKAVIALVIVQSSRDVAAGRGRVLSERSWPWVVLRLTNKDSKWVSSGVRRRGISQFAQFSEDSDRSWMVDQNRSCTTLHRINERERESIGKPAKTSGDEIVKFVT